MWLTEYGISHAVSLPMLGYKRYGGFYPDHSHSDHSGWREAPSCEQPHGGTHKGKSPANSHMNEPMSWKQILQPQSSSQNTAAPADSLTATLGDPKPESPSEVDPRFLNFRKYVTIMFINNFKLLTLWSNLLHSNRCTTWHKMKESNKKWFHLVHHCCYGCHM